MYRIPIKINQYQLHDDSGTLGMSYILKSIHDSNLFDVSWHDELMDVGRGCRATILKVEDKKIYLDFWEYSCPTYTSTIVNYNFDLIIKLQHNNIGFNKAWEYLVRKGMFPADMREKVESFYVKMCPWTFFPSKNMMQYIGKEEQLWNHDIATMGFFCGKMWKSRGPMKKYLRNNNIEILSSDQGLRHGKTLTDEIFIKKMLESKYGIVLCGKSIAITDAKNRREIDYMMMKKPLLLNYKPFYYDPLIEGKHYIFLNENTQLDKIESCCNIDEMVENAYEWYLRNASPHGVALSLKKLLKEKLNIGE